MKMSPFDATTKTISMVGLGGEGVLRTYGQATEAEAVIREAIKQGITYFDSARAYSDSELYYGRVWGKDPVLRRKVFQTSKSASRDRAGARSDLENTLKRLQTTYLDLWQIHDVRTEEDLLAIGRPGGALETFIAAKEEGLVRHIGVTGHHDPTILTKAVNIWPVDSVLLPVNPIEKVLGGFLTETLPAACKKGIAVIGMKLLGGAGGHYILPKLDVTAEALIRFSLANAITLPIVGCSNPEEVKSLVSAVKKGALADEENRAIVEIFRPYAKKMAFYRGVK